MGKCWVEVQCKLHVNDVVVLFLLVKGRKLGMSWIEALVCLVKVEFLVKGYQLINPCCRW